MSTRGGGLGFLCVDLFHRLGVTGREGFDLIRIQRCEFGGHAREQGVPAFDRQVGNQGLVAAGAHLAFLILAQAISAKFLDMLLLLRGGERLERRDQRAYPDVRWERILVLA
jgi:hypothetical protein